ncbi:MAG: WbqC family protein [Sphingobacteriales bacterium]
MQRKKIVLVVECQYLPPVSLFKSLGNVSDVKIEQYEYYQKFSFRNRCLLAGPNGILSLSVPLEDGRDQKRLIRDVKISYAENWQLRHWRSIHDAYRKSPFFEEYMDDIKSFFETKPAFLFDWNLMWLEWLVKQSGLKVNMDFTKEYVKEYPEGYIDLRSKITPKNYLEQSSGSPEYVQVFSERRGFQPNLSFLDMLLCEGPVAGYRLWT